MTAAQDHFARLVTPHGAELISMAPAPNFGDAYLAMGDEIEEAVSDEGDDNPPA